MTTVEAKQLAQQQKERGEFDVAAQTLADAIAEEPLAEVQAELYGILGGVRRHQGDLAASVAAYDAGFQREPAENTYNKLNRLVVRILLQPRVLSEADALHEYPELEQVDVPRTLELLGLQLQQQIHASRNIDYWTFGDLALISALTDDREEVFKALDHMQACTPPLEAYRKYHETVAALATLETPQRPLLTQAKKWLAQRL